MLMSILSFVTGSRSQLLPPAAVTHFIRAGQRERESMPRRRSSRVISGQERLAALGLDGQGDVLFAAPEQPAGHRKRVGAIGRAESSRRLLQLAADDLQFAADEAVQ